MTKKNLGLPNYLPPTLILALKSQLEPVENPPARSSIDCDMLSRIELSIPKAFIESALASGLSTSRLVLMCHLIFNDTYMKNVWSFFREIKEEDVLEHEIYEHDSLHIFESAIKTYERFPEIGKKKSGSQIDKLALLLNEVKNIIANEYSDVLMHENVNQGHLKIMALKQCLIKIDPELSAKDTDGHSNTLDVLKCLDVLSANAKFYNEFQSTALVEPQDYLAIKRENKGRRGLIRMYMSYIRASGLDVKNSKFAALVIPSILTIVWSLLDEDAHIKDGSEITESEVRKVANMINDAEDIVFQQYEWFIDKIPFLDVD